ncbi:shikimate kinase [Paenibacillus filicis]|uniref:Shikimate kinase n=1 Tax=Paenibacillus gyeongsangnamensis TaxID=3388067 RepID=A0ABT4QIC9_9BACL|nr:shikimate kinase [Paenibacillus filicis]MCZ8516624.1 shikimate kinase [Paenibacillus filicis]
MKFILIFGPQAVGKMTVGHELEKITPLKLFHNHQTIELLYPYFGFGPEMWRLNDLFRKEIFEQMSKSNSTGFMFTYVWGFDLPTDWEFVDQICNIFETKGHEVCFVELEADIEERLIRNKSPHRLHHKPTKRDVERSEKDLIRTIEKHRLNSLPGEITRDNYIRIQTTNRTPEETALLIKERFQL